MGTERVSTGHTMNLPETNTQKGGQECSDRDTEIETEVRGSHKKKQVI